MKKKIQVLIYILIILLLSFKAVKPFFVKGFFTMHDDTQPARVYEMAKALSFRQFPVRWVPDLGYGFGYPLFNFYAPLPYYLGAAFNLLGLNLLTSTKLMFIFGIVISGIAMYFLLREIAGDICGITGSLLYVYAPYHAVNIYVRGAVGEFYAYGFLPFLLLGVLKFIKKDFKQGIIIVSLSLFFILVSHNILGLITGYFLIFGLFSYLFYLIIRKQKLFTFYFLLFTFALGFGLSSFFTVPALMEKKYTKVTELTAGGSDFRHHFVYLDQLWNSPFGYAGSAPGRADGMSFKIGKLYLVLGLAGIFFVFLLYKSKKIKSRLFSLFFPLTCIFFISLFLMLENSQVVWEMLPGFSYTQYPWRFLNIVIFSLVFFSSALFIKLKKKAQIILATAIIGLTLWFNAKYFSPREYIPFSQEEYLTGENLSFKISGISDEYLPPDFIVPENYQETALNSVFRDDNIIYTKLSDTPSAKEYNLDLFEEKRVAVNLAFFPGWQAKLDGEFIEIDQKQGLIAMHLPSGKHKLEIILRNTPVRMLSNTVSLFSLFLLGYVSLFWRGNITWPKNIRSKQ